MQAMVLTEPTKALVARDMRIPNPQPREVLLKVRACGVCRTDLHILDGDLLNPRLPLVLGHEIVGIIESLGDEVERLKVGDRVGVPWLGSTCGMCKFCASGRENLCDFARFTGYQINGGYAEYAVADERYCFKLPPNYSDVDAAPLLCAGLIGYRSLIMAGDARRLGIYGFGAAAHIVAQVARWQGREVYAFTRQGDHETQQFARDLGVTWAGDSNTASPTELDAAILFAPVGDLVPFALRNLTKGGTVVCGGIHMSDIPQFPYSLLWGERSVRSVANLTRRDGEVFFQVAPRVPVRTKTVPFRLSEANEALSQLRRGILKGAGVLCMD